MSEISFFLSESFACGYFAEFTAKYLLLDPKIRPDIALQDKFVQKGFRRSGDQLYYPYCGNCGLCIPSRVNVNDFSPSKSQKRCLSKNSDLIVTISKPSYSDEVFELYRQYQQWKHAGGGMDNYNDEDMTAFLDSNWADSQFIQFKDHNGALLAVAVTDIYISGISAVYTFYHPQHAHRGLGNYAILQQINHAKTAGFDYLYLGFYLKNNQKMSYKDKFQPLELFIDGHWRIKKMPARTLPAL